MFKILLVLGMISAHIFQLLHDGVMFKHIVSYFSIYINAVTFSGFLFAFGYATQMAYLNRPKNGNLKKKLIKNGCRLLLAFYISGFAYALLVAQRLTFWEATKIMCLWRIPGYSEFLLSFAMLMPIVWFMHRPLNFTCANEHKMGGVICIALCSTLIPYSYVIIPLIGVFIGTTKFACFPLLQYSPFFLFGIYFSKKGMNLSPMSILIAFFITAISIIFIMINHSLPQRFPPECLWIILPCAPLACYWWILSKIKEMSFVNRFKIQICLYGSNMLEYLVISNVLIFLLRYCFGQSFNFYQCIITMVFIFACCDAYTRIKLKYGAVYKS